MLGSIITAMATPFDADLRVDEGAASRLAEHLLASGSDAIVTGGTTGEGSTLSDDEKLALVRIAVREAGARAQVIAGSGSNDTAHSVELTARAAEAGADAALVVTPYYNRPPPAGIVAHVTAVAAVGLPVVLYNIPGRTTVNMDPDLIAELATIPGVEAVKQANPDLAECRRVVDAGTLAVYAGNDDMLLPVLEMGGAGVISVASHLVGRDLSRIAAAAARGDWEEARASDAALAELYAELFLTTNPILVKAALELAGLIPSARVRLPLVEATPAERERLRAVLDRHDVLTRA